MGYLAMECSERDITGSVTQADSTALHLKSYLDYKTY